MAITTKSFKAEVVDRDALLKQREKIDVQLAETDEQERLRQRAEAVEKLAAIPLPDEAEVKRARADADEAKKNYEAKLNGLRVAEANYTAAMMRVGSQRDSLNVLLEKTCSPQIVLAHEELARKAARARTLRQSIGGQTNCVAVDAFERACQQAQRDVQELRYLAVDEGELEKLIGKLFRALPKEKFPLVAPSVEREPLTMREVY